MPGSSEKGKARIASWFSALPQVTSVLDVGPGWGTFVKLLRQEGQVWHAVEAFKPCVAKFRLDLLYDRVFIGDMRSFAPTRRYDVVICGDVLEHVLNFEAVQVVTKLLHHCRYLILSLPLDDETNAPAGTGDVDWGNPYELHKGRWSDKLFRRAIDKIGGRILDSERFPEIAVYLVEPLEGRLINVDAVEVPLIVSQDAKQPTATVAGGRQHLPSSKGANVLASMLASLGQPGSYLARFRRPLKRVLNVQGWATPRKSSGQMTAENWHEAFIEQIASMIKPRVYVELGLYRCALFNRIVPHARLLIGVDIDPEAGKFMARSRKARFVNSTTDEFAASLRARPIAVDMMFIDADHSKDAVLRDFWSFLPYVTTQGSY